MPYLHQHLLGRAPVRQGSRYQPANWNTSRPRGCRGRLAKAPLWPWMWSDSRLLTPPLAKEPAISSTQSYPTRDLAPSSMPCCSNLCFAPREAAQSRGSWAQSLAATGPRVAVARGCEGRVCGFPGVWIRLIWGPPERVAINTSARPINAEKKTSK